MRAKSVVYGMRIASPAKLPLQTSSNPCWGAGDLLGWAQAPNYVSAIGSIAHAWLGIHS